MPSNYLLFLIIALALGALFLVKQRSFAGADQVKSYLQQGAKVIDVRTPEEYASGHLPGALNIPFHNLRAQITRHIRTRTNPCCSIS